MTADFTFIAELEHAIARGSAQRRAEILWQVTDLFVSGSVRLSEDEIGLFDDVLTRLALGIEVSVRVLLAHRLAPLANAPVNITRMLASDDDIRVAAPILAEWLADRRAHVAAGRSTMRVGHVDFFASPMVRR